MIKDLDYMFKTNYIMVSKPMIRVFGIEAALMLADLYSEYKYWENKKQLTSDGYFFSTVENVENSVGLSKSQQLAAIKKLSDYGIIKKVLRGMPSKRYFRFEQHGIDKLKKEIGHELKRKVSAVDVQKRHIDVNENVAKDKSELGSYVF